MTFTRLGLQPCVSLRQYTPAVVLLGGPGAGKGSSSTALMEQFGWYHISTGNIFRQLIADGISPGPEVSGTVRSGELVPDDIVLDLVSHTLNGIAGRTGLIFDGCPRTLRQAEALQEMLQMRGRRIALAVLIDIPDDRLIARAAARRTCSNIACQRSYGQGAPPERAGLCDGCGCELIQREDDRIEVVLHRLRVARRVIQPIADFYLSLGLLKVITPATDWKSRQIASVVCELVGQITGR